MNFNSDYLPAYGLLFIFISLLWFKKLPSTEGWREFLHSLDSKGGNVLILVLFSLYSATQSIKLLWHLIYLVQKGQLKGDEGVTQVAVAFVTTNLASGFIGALIKTLTGSNELEPTVTVTGGTNATTISSTTSSTSITPADPATPTV